MLEMLQEQAQQQWLHVELEFIMTQLHPEVSAYTHLHKGGLAF
jgi:hypothetical protein